MKKIALFCLSIILLSLVALSVNAAELTGSTVSSPLFGGQNSAACDPNYDGSKGNYDSCYVEGKLTLSIPGATSKIINITGITFTTATGFNSKGSITSSYTPIFNDIDLKNELAFRYTNSPLIFSGNTMTSDNLELSFKSYIPASLNAVDSNLKETAFEVGTVSVTYKLDNETSQSISSKVYMQRENQLTVKKAYAEVANDETKLNQNDEVENLKPGDIVSVRFETQNTFSTTEEVSIENVELAIVNDNSELDIEDDLLEYDTLTEDDSSEESTSFTIENEADGSYTVYFDLTGEDEFGANHGERYKTTFKVERMTHEIAIDKMTISPNPLSCQNRDATLTVGVSNIGRRNEDLAAIQVKSTELNIDKEATKISLDKDDSTTKEFPFTVASNIKPGKYQITITTLFDDDLPSRKQAVELVVPDCSGTPVTPGTTPATNPSTSVCTENWQCGDWSICSNSQQIRLCQDLNACGTSKVKPTQQRTCDEVVTQVPPGDNTVPPATGNEEFADQSASPVYVAVLIIAIVIVLAIAIALVTIIIKQRQQE